VFAPLAIGIGLGKACIDAGPAPIPGTVTVAGVRVDGYQSSPTWNESASPIYAGNTLNGGVARVQVQTKIAGGSSYGPTYNLVDGAEMGGWFSEGLITPAAASDLQFRVVIAKRGVDYAGDWNDGNGGAAESTASYAAVTASADIGTVSDNGTAVELVGANAVITLGLTIADTTPTQDGLTADWLAYNETTTTSGTASTQTWPVYPTTVSVAAVGGDEIKLKVQRFREIDAEAGGTTTVNGTQSTLFTGTLTSATISLNFGFGENSQYALWPVLLW
jgi:hypothetical protein